MDVQISKKLKILVVDHDAALRSMIRRYFSQRYDLTILEAPNGLQGLQVIAEEFPDLIFLNNHMPVMGGMECLEILRSDPVYGHIHVMILSASQEKEQVRKFVELGISGFIAKPIELKDFTNRVEKVLAMLQAESKEIKKTGIKINPFALRVLIVDGNRRFRSFFCSLFENRYDMYEASTGMKALQIYEEHHPDVVCIGDGLLLMNDELLIQKIRQLNPQKNVVILSCAEWMPSDRRYDALYTGWVKKSLMPDHFVSEVEQCIVKKHLFDNRLRLAARNFVVPNFMELLKQVIDVEEDHLVEDFMMETRGLDLFGVVELYDARAKSKVKVGIQGGEQKLLRVVAQLKEDARYHGKTRREIIEDMVRMQAENVALAFQTIGIRVERRALHLMVLNSQSSPVNWSIGYAVKTKTEEKYIAGFIFE